MKKLMYLLVAGTMFVFTACNCGAGDAAATDSAEAVVACADDCTKTCCAAAAVCPNTGEPCLDDHSCCGSSSVDSAYPEDSHEGHDHSDEGHSH